MHTNVLKNLLEPFTGNATYDLPKVTSVAFDAKSQEFTDGKTK